MRVRRRSPFPTPPIRFLLSVLGLWIGGRLVFVGFGDLPPMIDPVMAMAATIESAAPVLPMRPAAIPAHGITIALDPPDPAREAGLSPIPGGAALADAGGGIVRGPDLMLASYTAERRSPAGFSPAFADPAPRASRWSGSGWAYVRQGSNAPLATGGQLGGSQAGFRLAYRINDDLFRPVALTLRATSPLGQRGAELALGIEAQPIAGLPVRLSLARRIGLDRAGRDAWELMAAGGVYDRRLPGGLRLDGYAQAGVVGTRARDLFVDGAVRIGRPVALSQAASITIGGGIWGAAQPGAARLDIGPQAVLRAPLGRTAITAALDWRIRITGDARPDTGLAMTLASDF